MERNSYTNENQPSRRFQPNTDRYSRWSEDDDRMDRDERYGREDSETDRFHKYTRGAPYSTYGSQSNDSYRDQGRNSSDYYRNHASDYGRDYNQGQNYGRAPSQSLDQTPYQNFGRSSNFSDQSRYQGQGMAGTQSYDSSARGLSSQNQWGQDSGNQSPGYSRNASQGSRSPYYDSSYNTQSYNQYGQNGNGFSAGGSYGNGYGQNYGSQSSYSPYPNSSQSYSAGDSNYQRTNTSDWGRSSSRPSTPWSQGQQSMSSKSGKAPKGYKRSDDRIKEEISDLLTAAPHVDPSDIEIKVSSGEVTLTGTIEDRREKRIVEDLIETISGVTEVHNQLRVVQNQDRYASHSATSSYGSGQSIHSDSKNQDSSLKSSGSLHNNANSPGSSSKSVQ